MRLERASRELYCKPWAIMPATYQTFHEVFQRHLDNGFDAKTVKIMGEEFEYKVPQEYDIVNGVAVISIDGVLGHRLSGFEKACMGAVDYSDIQEAISKAENDESVSSIVLDINSPGGMVTGLHETAVRITESTKPVVAYSDSLVASAGYYLACSASSVFVSGSSQIGCIGTLMTWTDVSKRMKMLGLKTEMIASGKYKGMLFPGIPVTDEQRELLEDNVDTLATSFKNFVVDRRGNVPESLMEGQTVFGAEAKAGLLIDEIGTLADAIYEAAEIAG